MRLPILVAALLTAASLGSAPVVAEEATTAGGTAQGATGQGAAATAGTAEQGGMQGDCPAGQVQSAGGGCAAAQPAGAEMPATPHQQELIDGEKEGAQQ